MSLSTALDQTYFKLHCHTCGCVTPHRDNSTTIQCEVCLYSNYAFSASPEYYTGWELAFFWQARYRSVVGYGVHYPLTAIAGPTNQVAITVGDKTWWTDPPAQKLAAGAPAVNFVNGTILLAEPIEGGMLVSPGNGLPNLADYNREAYRVTEGFATDYAALREENTIREQLLAMDELPCLRPLQDDLAKRISAELSAVAPGIAVNLNMGGCSYVFTRKEDGTINVSVKPSIDPNSIGTL
jgi:hypothetical protein